MNDTLMMGKRKREIWRRVSRKGRSLSQIMWEVTVIAIGDMGGALVMMTKGVRTRKEKGEKESRVRWSRAIVESQVKSANN